MNSLTRIFKIIAQLGLRQLSLYALYKLGLKTGHYKRTKAPADLRLPPFDALFDLPSRESLLQTLGEDGKEKLIQEAEEIVAGKFRMFGGELAEIKLTGDWLPAHWTDFETGKIKLDGDIKLIWEPARFGWAFVLGRAYHIAQDHKYAETFWKYFEIFSASNPADVGAHWMNGQEVALRLIAFVWALRVFPSAKEQKTRLVESIAHHASRVALTLAYARSQNNNHLVTESAALYTAGLLLKNRTWRALGWRRLNDALQSQISGYGEYIQHSVNYHRVMLQTALWINFIKRDVFPANTIQALSRSSHWLFSMLDTATGHTPNFGSNDGALILPLSVSDFRDYRPTVQAAARAFLKTNLPAGAWDEMSLWLNLPANERVINSEDYLIDNIHGKNSWAHLRASAFKSRLAHADQLHLDLWRRGLNIAQDAGTYMYNAEPPWDNPLTATRVHNTVTIDGQDQTTRAGKFMALDWVNAYSKNIIATDENILSCARAHYRLRSVKHERTVAAYRDERWVIRDEMTVYKNQKRVFRLHWLLPDYEWKIENREFGFEIRLKSPQGWITLVVNSAPKTEAASFSLVRAGELIYGQRDVKPYEGWVSQTYGQKSPALSLAVEVESSHDVEFVSEFIF
ncbi:MAG: heparinase II/III family protein [Anaerolineales bacterium]|nr:heparinase II/III family protein [Anaerolineales bacterium]